MSASMATIGACKVRCIYRPHEQKMVMDEDMILGTVTIIAVIGCGIANLFCVWFNCGHRRDEEQYIALRDIV